MATGHLATPEGSVIRLNRLANFAKEIAAGVYRILFCLQNYFGNSPN